MGIPLHPERGDRGFQRRPESADGSSPAVAQYQPAGRHQQPGSARKLFTFEVDILRNDVCDISMNLQLTERVLVSTDGSVSSVEAVPEPDEPEEMWTVKRG